MALEPKLFQKLSQQLVMTPQLRQAIKILQVSRGELESLIESELEENPVLEEGQQEKPAVEPEAEEPRVDGVMGEVEPLVEAPKPEAENAKDLKEIDWGEYFENYGNEFHGSSPNDTAAGDDDRRPSLENVLTKTEDLLGHLQWQVRMSSLGPDEESIVGLIIGNVDNDGYLGATVEEIASLAGVEPSRVEAVLAKVQEFDPPGVCARDLRECLLIQLHQLGLGESLAARIVREHLDTLESRRFEKLARDLGVSTGEVIEASKVVSSLEPKPGRNFGEAEARYVTPDVYVTKVGEDYVITLNDDGLPYLRVSNYYRKILGSDPTGEAKGYIQEKMRSASWLIKSIQQRQRTIHLVTQSIVKFQRDFFEKGVSGLRPLVLKDVANDIGMHESTVSRATSNKYVHTPQGTFELKFFFTSSLRAGAGEDVSSESVKQRIREMIQGEDARHPYSDQYIAELLAKENVDIARRTVAKYREMMAILPSSKRKQPY
jgi:RNA polymerase sigma-54 factor